MRVDKQRAGLLAVGALAVVPYLVALNAFWVGDDYNYVVPKTLDTILNFWNPIGRAAYRPTNWLSWALDYTVFGPNPPGWHLTSVAFHVVNTVLVVLLLRELARSWWPADPARGQWLSLTAGALFALHPAHPETVTWTGGRADLPFATGLFLAAWALARWRTSGRAHGGFYGLAWLGVWLSIMGKEAGMITPLALLLVDWAMPEAPAGSPPAPLWRPGDLLRLGRAVLNGAGRVALYLALTAGVLAAQPTPFALLLGQLLAPALLLIGVPGRGVLRAAPPDGAGRLTRLVRDHVPFLALAGAYAGMRVVLFLTDHGRLMYGTETHLQVGPGTLIDAAAGYLLLGLGAWEAAGQVPAWPLLANAGLVGLGLAIALGAIRRLGRPALFAVLWIPATVLVTFEAAAARWFYVASFGVCVLAALALAEVAATRPRWRILPAVALGLLWGAITVGQNSRWVESGEVAQGILAQIRALHPDPARPATFYMANPPYSYRGVLLFNSGFSQAPGYVYQDYRTITGYELQEHAGQVQAALADPAQLGPHPVFLRYEAGRVREYPSLAALVAAQTQAGGPAGR
ncbi:MAG TPA: hypothetical protein VKY74_00020 [Chloroflexia bacterium]|nr:hypothetical protein [Chloroflexia bacterium]